MPYTELLNKIITNSKLSIKEIARRCNDEGIDITAAYISALKNNQDRTPSANVSRAIAKACGAPENQLVLEAYFDNAPPEFKVLFDMITDSIAISIASMMDNNISPEEMAAFSRKLKEMPISELVQEMANQKETIMGKASNSINFTSVDMSNGETTQIEFTKPTGFPIVDDSMEPVLPKDGIVNLQVKDTYSDYVNGDILCYRKTSDQQIYFRQATFLNDSHTKMTMAAFNQKYPVEILSSKEISIIGRVSCLTVEF